MASKFFPPQTFSGTLQPGEERKVDGPNVFIRIIDASAAFNIAFDLGQSFPTNKGLGYQCLPDENFDRVTLSNPSGTAVTFSVTVGRMRVYDDRLNVLTAANYLPVTDPVTALIGQNIATLAGGANKVLTGVPPGGYYRRSGVLVTNAAAAAALTVYDAAGNITDFVLAGSSRFIPCSGYVKISNDTGGAIACAIGEIWQVVP